MQVIIYLQENGSIAVVYPSGEIEINEVARKDVPAGVPFKFVDTSELPEEFNEFFDAWEADFSNPNGYGIGADAWFAEKALKEELNDNN